jgi:hypothetical protein
VQACYECVALFCKVIGKVRRLEAQLPGPVSLPVNQTLLEPVNPRLNECSTTLNLVAILKVSTKENCFLSLKVGCTTFLPMYTVCLKSKCTDFPLDELDV